MELIHWFVDVCRNNPSIPIFLTLGLGFWFGNLKFKGFSLGVVTSVLLFGVLIGQMDITIPGPIKNVFFLIFLFAIGYSVGPQFFRALRGSGIKQVIFACVICLLCLFSTWMMAKIMHYNQGEAVGLFAGAQTISAVIGVGSDTIGTLGFSEEERKQMIDIIPVAYAVTYVFGTIGSAYLLANVGPLLLGGLKKVKADTAALEKEMNTSSTANDPAYIQASRPIVFRAYKVEAPKFASAQTVESIEKALAEQGRRIFVERIRTADGIIEPTPQSLIKQGDEVVLSGRREFVIGDESWLGQEISDPQLLDFPAESVSITIAKKQFDGMTIDKLRANPFMYGVSIKSIKRGDVKIPVLAQTTVHRGDSIAVVGLPKEVEAAGKQLGYIDKPTIASNIMMIGFGIFIGCLIGVITIKIGDIPVSLSTSGGALIMGLVCGWARSHHPSFAGIPQQSIWILNNLGLNMFIAVIGITSGPSFVSGIKTVGFGMFFAGIVATSLPLILGVIIGDKIFKFRPALNLGCCAGGRTTTASLGAIEESLGSTIPAMGYTITYAVGNTLLILMGVAMVLMT